MAKHFIQVYNWRKGILAMTKSSSPITVTGSEEAFKQMYVRAKRHITKNLKKGRICPFASYINPNE